MHGDNLMMDTVPLTRKHLKLLKE